MKDFFKPEDFEDYDSYLRYNLCRDVNEKLNKLIESWPVVYGNIFISNDGSAFDVGSVWNITKLNDKTHKARLAFIEEIKKEPCNHVPREVLWSQEKPFRYFECTECGVELQATWREVK